MKKSILLFTGVLILAVGGLVGAMVMSNRGSQTALPSIEPFLTDETELGDPFMLVESSVVPESEDPGDSNPESSKEAGTSPSVEAAASVKTVSMTDTGFLPASITVPVGTTVLFVNNGQAPHWPASDPHPEHSDLPAFDAKQPLQTGEEYSYTFSEAGTWKYHDHLMPSVTGVVVVD